MSIGTYLGQDSSGDFDQLSLEGVDFGERYTNDYGINPNHLVSKRGKEMSGYDDSQQLGNHEIAQLGLIPQGMGHYDTQQLGSYEAQQLGLIPEGLGGFGEIPDFGSYYDQMGELPGRGLPPQGFPKLTAPMGGLMDALQKPVVAGIPMWALAGVAAGAAWYFMKKK